jgi:uncharacterized RDD family membrane protein YckC
MTKSRFHFLTACWLLLALSLLSALRATAQESPPAPPPQTEPAASAEATPAGTDTQATEEKKDAGELRELGAEENKPAAKPTKKRPTTRQRGSRTDGPPIGGHQVPAGKTQGEAVSLFGDTVVDGHVTDSAVSIMGNTTVNGSVDGDTVAIMGNVAVNGRVKGGVVAVMGDVILGPDAVVDGQIVAVMGQVVRQPGAQVHGGVQQVGGFASFDGAGGLRAWVKECLFKIRLLAFDSRLVWAWGLAFGILAFYALIALIAPGGVGKCVATLEQRPGYSLLSALLTMLLTPVAFILLTLTLFLAIGFVLIPLFAFGLFLASIFGKIVILAWLGRRFTNLLGDSPLAHPFFGVLIGGMIMLLLYTIPVAGFVIYKLVGILGLGVVVYTIIRVTAEARPPKAAPAASGVPAAAAFVAPPPPVVAAPPAPPAAGEAASAFVPPVVPAAAPPPVPTLPPVISAATLPRAGFWIRFGAVFLDAILVGMVCGFLGSIWSGFGVFPFWFAVYCVVMWANKGTTIGGIICGLKLVRLDDRPLDWTVAIVRALGGFLSLAVAGLGFIWVAFDDDRQSWHDKIAGTTIVRVPKGVALL